MPLTDKLTAIADAIRAQSGKTDKLTLDQMPTEIIDLQSLNFEVVGNPQPESPKENTVWVDTDATITGWVFSATEPETPSEGLVWIYTGTTSPVTFNALKKNGISVCPLSAKQYVSGAWVEKTAKTYQSGAWKDWITWLYNNGDECVELTGGYVARSIGAGNSFGITNGPERLIISMPRTSGAHGESIGGTVNMVDLTDFNTLQVTISDYYNQKELTEQCRIGVYNSANSPHTPAALINPSGNGVYELDISTLSGEYYVFYGISSFWYDAYNTASFSVVESRLL